MIIEDIIILFMVSVINFIALLIAIFVIRKSPPKVEMGFIVLSLIFAQLTYFFYSINSLYSTPSVLHIDSIVYTRVAYIFAMSAIIFVTCSVLFVDFKPKYIYLIEIIAYTSVGFINAIYNALTLNVVLIDDANESQYTLIGLFLIIVFFSFTIVIWMKRIVKIYLIKNREISIKTFLRSFILFIIFGTGIILLYITSTILYSTSGYLAYISGGSIALFGAIFIFRNNSFLFVTNVTLDSIIIMEKLSGIRLYATQFSKSIQNPEDSDFLASVISAINISISTTLRSKKDLSEMQFSDKTILMSTGDHVRAIMILSSSNFIAKSISLYLVKCFEKKFGKQIEEILNNRSIVLGNQSNYLSFKTDIDYVRMFIPL